MPKKKDENESLRTRLIIAGIDEISSQGLANFSLRRVAAACYTSCASPYKHFKNKDDFIEQIVAYIEDKWLKLRAQIMAAFPGDPEKQLIEISVAYILFWTTNPNYRSVLALSPHRTNDDQNSLTEVIDACVKAKRFSPEDAVIRTLSVKAMVRGFLEMLENKELENTPETFSCIRTAFERQFKNEKSAEN